MKTFIGITGTTCVGKSAVSVKLAQILGTEIISADSMQIYKGMDVGTAKITDEEMQGVKHHMLDVLTPDQEYSSFLYQQDAGKIIDEMSTVPIVVGGTGFYFDSLLFPPEFSTATSQLRQQIADKLKNEGLESLQKQLFELDVDTYNTIDLKNPKRVTRALEIALSGQKRSQGNKDRVPNYDCKLFVLQIDREKLYNLIDERVDLMVQKGLVDEVKQLVDKYGFVQNSAFSAIGYKEIIAYLQNQCTLEEAIYKIKLNTRHYAKRQITYYKKMKVLEFINVEGKSAEEIALYIARKCRTEGINE